jgi:predicted GNAT family N-acyltransferase
VANPESRPLYRIEALATAHNRTSFSCGVPALDAYLQRQARQDHQRKLVAVFVLTADGQTIDGFYTLSAHSILAADLPETSARALPRFPLPVTLLGRMAVSQRLRGQRMGEFLLMHALERAWLGSQQVASRAVVVDTKEDAREFYLKYDFVAFPAQPDRLFLPMASLARLFR